MFATFIFMMSVSALFGLAMYVDTKYLLPKRTAKYLKTMRAINEANQK